MTGSWTDRELELLAGVERALAAGTTLKAWWEASGSADATERFELATPCGRSGGSVGFLGEAVVDGRPLPVMGNVQEAFFDRPKAWGEGHTAAQIRRQLREFVLRWFMRVSAPARPLLPAGPSHAPLPGLLRPLSWHPKWRRERGGFAYSQWYFARRDGERGRFGEAERHEIVDLRSLADTYRWIVAKVEILDFQLVLAPLGRALAHLVAPMQTSSYVVLSSDFVLDDGLGGGPGRYGLGYAFLPDVGPRVRSYGPGRFAAAFQVIEFHVAEDGEIRSRMAFVADRPARIVSLFGLDPILAYVRLANLVTRGTAERRLAISLRQLKKEFLFEHFLLHDRTVAEALAVWRQVPDWLDPEPLPARAARA